MGKIAFRVEFYHHAQDKKKSCWVVYNYWTYEMVAGGFATKQDAEAYVLKLLGEHDASIWRGSRELASEEF